MYLIQISRGTIYATVVRFKITKNVRALGIQHKFQHHIYIVVLQQVPICVALKQCQIVAKIVACAPLFKSNWLIFKTILIFYKYLKLVQCSVGIFIIILILTHVSVLLLIL